MRAAPVYYRATRAGASGRIERCPEKRGIRQPTSAVSETLCVRLFDEVLLDGTLSIIFSADVLGMASGVLVHA